MTRWCKPTEKLPGHNEQVLVREDDFIELAVYDRTNHLFHLRNGNTKTVNDHFTWMELLRSEAQ